MISCLSGCDCDGQYDDVMSADLQCTQQAADGVLAHVVQAHLEGADHHARLHLSSGGQQQGLSAQPQLLVLRLSRAEGLRRLQGVLGLEAVLRHRSVTSGSDSTADVTFNKHSFSSSS